MGKVFKLVQFCVGGKMHICIMLQNLLPVAPQFLGSENVVVAEMSRIPDVQLGNPCYQVRLFHQHCTGKRSKSRIHMTRINDVLSRNFGKRNMKVQPTVITVLRRRRSKAVKNKG